MNQRSKLCLSTAGLFVILLLAACAGSQAPSQPTQAPTMVAAGISPTPPEPSPTTTAPPSPTTRPQVTLDEAALLFPVPDSRSSRERIDPSRGAPVVVKAIGRFGEYAVPDGLGG